MNVILFIKIKLLFILLMANELTDEEIQNVSNILSKISPGYLPFPIFKEFARITTTPTVVLLMFYQDNDSKKVFLTKRDENDEFWPGLYHVPGAILRGTDVDIDLVLNRIQSNELGETELKSDPIFSKFYFKDTKRGKELTLAYSVQVSKVDASLGRLFSKDEINDKSVIDSEIEMINEAFLTG